MLPCLGGCASHARAMLGDIVAQERGRITASPSHMDDPLVAAYLDGVSAVVLEGAKTFRDSDTEFSPSERIYDRFDVEVVHDPLPNAWTYGDDFATMSTASLLFVEHPDELAFLLAHEFGHMYGEHMVGRLQRNTDNQIGAGFTAIFGTIMAISASQSDDQAKVEEELGMTPEEFFKKSLKDASDYREAFKPHRPKDELDADRIAVNIMNSAGLSLDRCADFLERVRVKYPHADSGTHPPTEERVKRIREHVAKLKEEGNAPAATVRLDEAGLKRVQARVIELAGEARLRAMVFYTAEINALLALGEKIHPALGCGPFDAGQDVIEERYEAMVGE